MGLDQYLRAKTNSITHKSSRGAAVDYSPLHLPTEELPKSDTGVKRMPFRIISDKFLKYMMISTLKTKKYPTTKFLKLSTTQER